MLADDLERVAELQHQYERVVQERGHVASRLESSTLDPMSHDPDSTRRIVTIPTRTNQQWSLERNVARNVVNRHCNRFSNRARAVQRSHSPKSGLPTEIVCSGFK